MTGVDGRVVDAATLVDRWSPAAVTASHVDPVDRPRWTRPAVAGQVAGRGPLYLLGVFYVAMAGIALYGQSDGLMAWLGVGRLVALAVALSVELLAAVLFAFADWRRTGMAERAVAARGLSVAVALGVALMNFYGHQGSVALSALYVGASLAGYAVWVLHTNARRRDALRAAGRLAAEAPPYGPWRWLRHPALTARARALAGADQSLGLHGSVEAARTQVADQRRHAALRAALRRKLAAGRDPISAELALCSYDLDRLARDLAGRMDYHRLLDLLAADLDPARLAATTVPAAAGPTARVTVAADGDGEPGRRPAVARPRAARRTVTTGAGADTAARVARLRDKHPELSTVDIARRLGVTDRTVRRHLADLRDNDNASTSDPTDSDSASV